MTVHVVSPETGTDAAAHLKEESVCGAIKARAAFWEDPWSEAVIVAVWLVVTAPSLTTKLALLDPARTLTAAGSVRTFVGVPEIATEAPPVEAALVKVTVQVLDALAGKLVAPHCREETAIEATSDTFAMPRIR